MRSLFSKSAISNGDGTFKIDTVRVAAPDVDEVLVRMKAAGLCHTDFDSLRWGKPIVMGHEGAGTIEALGSQVQHLEIGDAVILNWATPCRSRFQFALGNENICERNSPVVAGGNGNNPGHAHLEGPYMKISL